MRLFKKEKAQFGAEDVKATQDVVQSITAALKSGAEQQDIAAKRLGALTKSMAKMDENVRHAARLEVEKNCAESWIIPNPKFRRGANAKRDCANLKSNSPENAKP